MKNNNTEKKSLKERVMENKGKIYKLYYEKNKR